ncbi:hypothetical protein [Novosphingobium sp. AP12]|uniref:hypothetical protein n=1 Tax=Novosphingobium sp. AP12 TaxID=1144305 RepID=UPI000271E2EE|nr:hypothetical protein [Novosphingobium sp. AP12]EJL21935.1 hypothetical protein PMI02_04920 [Novosphingobium sp. AP12]
MTPWRWWAGHVGEESYDIAEEASREAVIAAAERELGPGDTFEIIEARSSEAAEYEGSDFVPFLRTRNHEIRTVGQVE